MHTSTKKWLFTKISSFILIPLMAWFLLNFVSIYDKEYSEILIFFSEQPSKILFSIFIVIAFFFSALTISEILRTIYMMRKSKMSQIKRLIYLL